MGQNDNRFVCIGEIVEKDVLRYTPAGVPIVSAKLHHTSEQFEAGATRSVNFEMQLIGAGEISAQIDRLPLNLPCKFVGFLTRKSRNSRSLALHVVEIEAA